MKLEELKEKVLNNSLSDNFLVLQYDDAGSKFVIFQYIDRIASDKKLDINYLEDETDLVKQDDIFGIQDNTLNILITDKFSIKESYLNLNNYIVICKSLQDDNFSDSVVKFTKLEDWQIQDYMSVKCKGLQKELLDWLFAITKKDIYRIENELNKLCIFDNLNQRYIFDLINKERGYADLSDKSIYDLSNAIIKKDFNTITKILEEIDSIDIEAYGLITILTKQFKNIIAVQSIPNITSKMLGISDKQLFAIKKYNCGYYSNNEIIKILYFLTSYDYKLKAGLLPVDKDDYVSYILVNILNKGEIKHGRI